jgi:hypothetical protein
VDLGGGEFEYGADQHCDTTDTTGNSCFSYVLSRCQKGEADEIIQFIAFGVSMVLLGLGYILMRQGGRGGGRSGGHYV